MARTRYPRPFAEDHTYLLRLLDLPREVRDPAIEKIAKLLGAYESYCTRVDCARPDPAKYVRERVFAKMERVVREAEERATRLREDALLRDTGTRFHRR